MTILGEFLKFKDEAAVIGRLSAGYAILEIDLMHCAHVVRGDLDTVLKAMFRARGEKQRIEVADAFGRQHYQNLGLGNEFATAIGAMHHCRQIRNQYAHCIWWDDLSGRLALANLEQIAQQNALVADLHGLVPYHVDVPHLRAQEEYFDYTDELLAYVNFEGRHRAGKLPIQDRVLPAQRPQPPLHIP